MDIVFAKPNKFENIIKYMDYVSNDVILHINFQDLDSKTAQRVLDFVSGAAYIKDAIIVTPGESVFCVLPKSKEYIMDYRNTAPGLIDPRHDEEEEIRPNRK